MSKIINRTIEKHYPSNIRTDVFELLMKNKIHGIPRVLSIKESENGWTVVEEFIEGQTLAEIIKVRLPGKKEAVKICRRLCEILKKLHSFGIVHGDIKPENIIITGSDEIYLIDFDASHFVKKDIGRDTVMMGTPGYASPEQFGFGRSDPRSDIYAIGVLLNVLITGQHPLYKMADGRISIVIEKCIDVDPVKRYQNVSELEKGLKHPSKAHEFLPVGFRTLNPWKMIIAVLGYALIVFLAIKFQATYDWEVKGFFCLRIWFIVFSIGTIGIFFNYGRINNLFAKDRTKRHVAVKFLQTFLFLILTFIGLLILGHLIGAFQ